jgi:hypothetical protein
LRSAGHPSYRPDPRVTIRELCAKADQADLRLVRFLWCGNDGTIRAKASGRRGLEDRLHAGIGLTVAMQAMSGLDELQPVAAMGPVGEIRLAPDIETFRVLPYAPRTGVVLTDHVNLDGQPAPVCQRSFLKRMEGRLAERGLVLRAAFENEFSLATRVDGAYVPIDSALCFATIAMTAAQDYIDELVDALEAQAIVLEQYYAELGHGCSCAKRSARWPRGADSSRRWPPSRGPRTPATAPTSTSRSGRTTAIASTSPPGRTASLTRRGRSWRVSWPTCPGCAGSARRASTPTIGSCRTSGPAP